MNQIESTSRTTSHPRETPSVLVVEDEVIVAMDFERCLKRLGYTVTGVAHNGPEAIEQAFARKPELVLMDINLGHGMSGVEAALAIQEKQDLPIIYVTANSDPDTVRRAARSSPFGYVLKPFEDRELETAIQMGMIRHGIEQRLRESERRFHATLTSIADGLIATDAKGRVAFFNPSAEKITGRGRSEVLGCELTEAFLLRDDGTHQHDTDFLSFFKAATTLPDTSRTALLVCADQSLIPVEYRAAYIHDDQGNPGGVVISFSDIQERKLAEEKITRARLKLSRAHEYLLRKHEELQQFYHTVSHELKTPLTSGREFVSLVLEGLAGPVTPTQKEYLGMALESCDQMRNCINDMLDVTRIETGKMRVEFKPGSVTEVARKVVAMLRPAADAKHIQLSCREDSGVPEIHMDASRIAQVITNLLNNALKFTPEGGQVEVHVSATSADNNRVCISVADTGRGIPKENLNRIFDRLYQVSEADSASSRGLGLGLHICREIVVLHGGRIRAESELGRGSTFFVTLPVQPQGKPRVLVVDADPEICELLRMVLETDNYLVATARSADEALNQMHFAPDLIVAELGMPCTGGADLLKEVRRVQPETPVIIYTGNHGGDEFNVAMQQQPVVFLRKPCEPQRFLRTVRNLLNIIGSTHSP